MRLSRKAITIETLLAKHRQNVRNRRFLEAAMGASAMLASADGEISFAELMARDYVLDLYKYYRRIDLSRYSEKNLLV